MKINFLILFMLLTSFFGLSKNMIIGDDRYILTTFRDGSTQDMYRIAQDISKNYSSVTIHLGARYPFERGSFFFYRTSQANLIKLSEYLNEFDTKLYLWIFDTFGGEQFLDFYQDRYNMVSENIKKLNELEDRGLIYEGLIIDLEWINLGGYNNNAYYLDFIKILRENLCESKELKAFASLIDSERENISRGYDLKIMFQYLDSVIPMLYIEDGAFTKRGNDVLPLLNDNRITSIKNFYDSYSKITAAVSVNKGIIIERDNQLFFIRTIDEKDLPKDFVFVREDKHEYFTIKYYRVNNNISFTRNDGVNETLFRNEMVYYYEPTNKIIDYGDFIWEYYIYQK